MRARHARPLYALRAGHPPTGLMAVWGVARPQGGQPSAISFPLGYPLPYGPAGYPMKYRSAEEENAKGGGCHGQADRVKKCHY
jgi:hypothetical protein